MTISIKQIRTLCKIMNEYSLNSIKVEGVELTRSATTKSTMPIAAYKAKAVIKSDIEILDENDREQARKVNTDDLIENDPIYRDWRNGIPIPQ